MYRIITNGRTFMVQKKGWFFWSCVDWDGDDCSDWVDATFDSTTDAKRFIQELERKQALPAPKWTVIESSTLP